MAVMRDVLLDVREDMIKRVGRINPGIEPTINFKPYESNEVKTAEQGGARSFTINAQSPSVVAYGSTTNDLEIIYLLEIKYELGPIWTDAAMDDYEAIVSAFQRTWAIASELPTGLDFYQVGDMTLASDEFFQTSTIPITARIVADVRS